MSENLQALAEWHRKTAAIERDGSIAAFHEQAAEAIECIVLEKPVMTGSTLDQLAEQANSIATLIVSMREPRHLERVAGIIRTALIAAEQRLEAQREQLEQAQEELESERIRLAACATAALGNTEAARSERLAPTHPYYSASYGDVCRAVDREIAYHDRAEKAEQQLAQVTQNEARYISLIRAIVRSWPDGDLDGGELQELAYQHGILERREVTEPCGDACRCADYGDFPATCYRLMEPFRSEQSTGATK